MALVRFSEMIVDQNPESRMKLGLAILPLTGEGWPMVALA